jgi:hypothetical protein
VTLPNYILRRYSEPGGVRLAKRIQLENTAGICPTCLKNVVFRKFNGTEQVDGVNQNGTFYHYTCRPRPQSWEEYGTPARTVDDGKVPLGNLSNEEYRYWVGSQYEGYVFAMCRACKKSKYGKHEREAHFRDPDFLVNGEQCTTRLVNAYKMLDHMTLCLVCKEKRYNQSMYGVPLCRRAECIKKWKFSTDRYIMLEHQLELQIKKQEFHQRKGRERMGEFVILPPDKATTEIWCPHCHMTVSNPAHAEHHMDMIERGEICED